MKWNKGGIVLPNIVDLQEELRAHKKLISELFNRITRVEAQTTFQIIGEGLFWNDPDNPLGNHYGYPEITTGRLLKMILDKLGMEINIQQKETTINLVKKDKKVNQM